VKWKGSSCCKVYVGSGKASPPRQVAGWKGGGVIHKGSIKKGGKKGEPGEREIKRGEKKLTPLFVKPVGKMKETNAFRKGKTAQGHGGEQGTQSERQS